MVCLLFLATREVSPMFGLQPAHVVIIVLVALLFFAPSRLPLLARGMKTMVSEFRKGLDSKNKDRDSK